MSKMLTPRDPRNPLLAKQRKTKSNGRLTKGMAEGVGDPEPVGRIRLWPR